MAITGENVTVRRISWVDLYRLRPDLAPKPDNDNKTNKEKAA